MRYLVFALTLVSAACSGLPTSPTAPAGATFTDDATQARRGSDLPFRGTLEATEVDQVVPPSLIVNGTGGGTATHLGRFTATFAVTVNLATGSGTGGTITLIAANGDQLFGTFTGQGVPIAPNVAQITEMVTITGGTGRFDGATGMFTIVRVLDQLTGMSSGSFDGQISLGLPLTPA